MPDYPNATAWVADHLRRGLVIPAHPLALTRRRRLDENRQRALTRYYHAAGSGGIAVGVHTTQFEIRLPKHGLLQPVLELASRAVAACDATTGRRTVRIAGICGATKQAVSEAELARDLGYHIGLLSLSALPESSDTDLIKHCRAVAEQIPIMGFYLQTAVGGRLLSVDFWRKFARIPNVMAIKIAPFNRYQTFDVVRAVVEAGRAKDLSLYTGNDDAIVLDLLTTYSVAHSAEIVKLGCSGGLLGHWACWTKNAVELLEQCRIHRKRKQIPANILTLAAKITDCNGAFFDAANGFSGCIAGIHEVLRRQRLLDNTLCLNPHETLSRGQSAEIDRVCHAYPDLNDDRFVGTHLDEWLSK